MLTKDLNAGYCCSHGLCCFSVISSEGSEAVIAMGQAVAIYKHHLHMAFSDAPTAHGAPARGGEMLKVRGSARARAGKQIKNRRRQYGG